MRSAFPTFTIHTSIFTPLCSDVSRSPSGAISCPVFHTRIIITREYTACYYFVSLCVFPRKKTEKFTEQKLMQYGT